jgi:hypothetical protein
MSIPLDNLYHYIKSIANKVYDGDVVISHFWPHGSKKLENLAFLCDKDWITGITQPWIVCHDQEPLDAEYYTNYYSLMDKSFINLTKTLGCWHPWDFKFPNIFDQSILIHSELQSYDVDVYRSNGFVPVYYWSHALIALDWFRFSKYIEQKKQVQKTFLSYNRSWAGSREYRIKFAELLIKYDLVRCCQTTFNTVDPDTNISYQDHVFKNSVWQSNYKLDDYFSPNTYSSCSSANFEIGDYENTEIEVVLETLFDDSRIQLTEKILRSIACGQPFILLGPAGSLKYLQSYGFQTYDSIWDESYDQITDPYQRLETVVKLMQEINNWDNQTKTEKYSRAQQIAQYNKKYFFSTEFFTLVSNELSENLQQALTQVTNTNTSKRWLQLRKQLCQYPELKNIMTGRVDNPDNNAVCRTADVIKILQKARKYYSNS